MSADEPTTSSWELWRVVSGNILFYAETAAAMRDFLREQLAEPATTGWLLTETTLLVFDTRGGYRVLAETPEAIRAWMEQT